MTDILQLPGWTVTSTTDDGQRLVIAAEYAKQPDSCQVCGVVGALYKHGPRSLSILDSLDGVSQKCKKAVVSAFPWVGHGWGLTPRKQKLQPSFVSGPTPSTQPEYQAY